VHKIKLFVALLLLVLVVVLLGEAQVTEVLGVGALLGHVASLAEALEARVAVSLDAVLYNRHQHVKLVQ